MLNTRGVHSSRQGQPEISKTASPMTLTMTYDTLHDDMIGWVWGTEYKNGGRGNNEKHFLS